MPVRSTHGVDPRACQGHTITDWISWCAGGRPAFRGTQLCSYYHFPVRVGSPRTGASVIIDSSKNPAIPALLARVGGVKICGVHLVRDPCAVAYSEQHSQWKPLQDRPPERPAWKSAVTWLGYNIATEVTRRKQQANVSWVRVRYEDFVSSPEAILDGIAKDLDLPLDSWTFVDSRTIDLPMTHEAAGNPNRFEPQRRSISLREEWVRHLRTTTRSMVSATTYPLRLRYGYHRLPVQVGRNNRSR